VALTHDSSTLGGNSGSVVVHIDSGEVVALHFAGSYLVANYGVPSAELGRDGRVIDAGVHFSGMPTRRSGPADAAWRDADGSEQAGPAGPEPNSADAASTPTRSPPSAAGGEASIRFTIPIEVTLRVGPPTVPTLAAIATVASESNTERMVEPFREHDYANRSGYDPRFLGIELPLPHSRDRTIVAPTRGGGDELRYHHFSVVMHKARRLALFTASNVDASPARKHPGGRPPSDYTRRALSGLGQNDQELWFTDGRIALSYQLPDRFFTRDRGSFDKGHLVRRDDVAWGNTYEELRAANSNTYHVTNCSPKLAIFNHSSAPGIHNNWGDLENLVLEQANTERLSRFSGPVLDHADPVFVGVDEDGPVRVKIPSRFWKEIVARDGAQFQSFGFLLQQDLADVNFEFATPREWRRFMAPIARIEELAGVEFPEQLKRGDQSGNESGQRLRSRAGIECAPEAGRAHAGLGAPDSAQPDGGPPMHRRRSGM
jgi:DNA/RNA endonuclease G (NUC1)